MIDYDLLTIQNTDERADIKEILYFVGFEFACGEYEQSFGKAFYAEDENDLEAKINEFLKKYYGENSAPEIVDDVYYYWNGEVGIRCVGWSEINNLHELIQELC